MHRKLGIERGAVDSNETRMDLGNKIYCIPKLKKETLTLETSSMFILLARFEIALHFTSKPTNPMLRFESRIAMSTARLQRARVCTKVISTNSKLFGAAPALLFPSVTGLYHSMYT